MIEFPISKSFNHQEEHYLAICELTLFKIDGDEYLSENNKVVLEGVWYYFNRLNVPSKIRNKGIAKKLLQEMSEWADQEHVSIWLDINPYGDLDLRQLISLYSRFGFKQTLQQGTMLRRYQIKL